MHTLWLDLKYGARMLRRHPGFAFVAILTLGLGIGANTAVFSVVNAVLLRPLPYPDWQRIVIPVSENPSRGSNRVNITYADHLDFRQARDVFSHVAVVRPGQGDLTTRDGPERVTILVVSEDFFGAVGVSAMRVGRGFQADEFAPTGERVAVISHGLWQRRFGGDPAVLTQDVRLGGTPIRVVGVLPPGVEWPRETDIWVPLRVQAASPDMQRRDNFIFASIARLQPGVTLDQARARVRANAARVEQDHPVARRGWTSNLLTLREDMVGTDFRTALMVLLGAVAFVLLIACANVTNLLLARVAQREREMAVRTALGAGRARLVRQLLTESAVVVIGGGAIGLGLAIAGTRLMARLAPADATLLAEIPLDGRVLLFTAAGCIVTAAVLGLLPALLLSGDRPVETLREGGRGIAGNRRSAWLRQGLVIAEITLAIVLLVGAGLLIRTIERLQQVETGVRVNGVLAAQVTLPSLRYSQPALRARFVAQAVERLRTVPGVTAVAAVSRLPVGGPGFQLGRVFLREGQPEPPASNDAAAEWAVATPGYFETMGIGLVKGRTFTERDAADATPVIVISETMARRAFGTDDPLGRRIRSWRDENVLREVIGVVRDVRFRGLAGEPTSHVYVPHAQDSWGTMVFAVRSDGDPTSVLPSVRREINALDPNLALGSVNTLEHFARASVQDRRFGMVLLMLFAAVALTLAGIGIYGVMAYAVTQRRQELGVRLALGASPRDLLLSIMRRGLALSAAGAVLGVLGAMALSQALRSLLFEVTPTDPITLGGVTLMLTSVALMACYVPARRAMRVDPVEALRAE